MKLYEMIRKNTWFDWWKNW